jgi:hypothetical protein
MDGIHVDVVVGAALELLDKSSRLPHTGAR